MKRPLMTLVLSLSLIWPHGVRAEVVPVAADNAKRLQNVLDGSRGAKSLGDYFKKIRPQLTFEEAVFLEEKVSKVADSPMPRVKKTDANTLTYSHGSQSLEFQMVSGQDRRFRLNGRELNLSDYATMQDRWEKIQTLVARSQVRNPWPELMVPQAEAAFFVFMPVAWAVLGLGLTAVGGAYSAAIYQCDTLRPAWRACEKSTRDLTRILRTRQARNGGRTPQCQNRPVSPTGELPETVNGITRETINEVRTAMETAKDLRASWNSTATRLPGVCSQIQGQESKKVVDLLDECLSILKAFSQELCFVNEVPVDPDVNGEAMRALNPERRGSGSR